MIHLNEILTGYILTNIASFTAGRLIKADHFEKASSIIGMGLMAAVGMVVFYHPK